MVRPPWRRRRCGRNLDEMTVAFQPGQPTQSRLYGPKVRVMKNAFMVFAHANRVEIKVKIEELVFVGEKCFIVKID